MIEFIKSGAGDVLVVYEISSRKRDLAIHVKIRDLCYAEGLYYWCLRGTLYDIRDINDRMNLGIQAVQAEFMADYIRDNTLRGIVNAAEKGRPHGRVKYGYGRVYAQRTKALLRQELARRAPRGRRRRRNHIDYVRCKRGLTARIADADARAQETSIPPVLRGRIGKHAARE